MSGKRNPDRADDENGVNTFTSEQLREISNKIG
jgi:hypothetical protein